MTKDNIKFDGDNGFGYDHWSFKSRFVCADICKTSCDSGDIFTALIYPNVDKGYRDPYEEKTFPSLDSAMNFIVDFINKE